MSTHAPPAIPAADRGVQLITAYKFVRGALALLAALLVATYALEGEASALHTLIEHLRAHFTTGVAARLSAFVMKALDARRVWIVVGGLILDGCFTLLEAVALKRGYTWGPWLVVIATSLLLPVEAVAWVRHPTIGRALLFVLNGLVAAYLAWRVMRERRREASRPA